MPTGAWRSEKPRAALFRGIVKAGRFCPDDVINHRAWLAKVEGKRVIESIQREKLARTMSQNRYYWGVVLATLAAWSGHETEELHLHFRDAILGQTESELPNGLLIKHPASTRVLTVDEFAEYVNRVVKWAAEQGVYVPAADEVS